MLRITDKIIIDDREILETFSRSSGPGGQHVNKVETSVTLKFSVINFFYSIIKIISNGIWIKFRCNDGG